MNEAMTRVKGMVHSFEDDHFKVLCDNNQWFEFPIPGDRPAVGERIVVIVGDQPVYERLDAKLLSAREIADTLYRFDQVETKRIPTADDVTEEDIQRFAEQGYLVIDQLLNEQEVADALQAIDDIIQLRIVGPRLQFMKKESQLNTPEERTLAMRKLHRFIDFAPALHHICFHPGLQRVLERVFGESARFLEDQAILKPPSAEAGGEKPWHQDMAYGQLSQTKMICGVWVALDEASLDNGCMHVIPGTHHQGAVPHFAVRDWQICDAHIEVERDVAIPLKPGGALFFAGMLHHGTPPNFSGRRRQALQFHYCPDSSERMTPKQFKEVFTSEMSGAEC
ncbi:phytanoyl-CoA dioxygenase family protein [Paenibacillaceae bacterium]|nr:phytanoyl-CoA dioxygenase family protein [Paenibacillaceae bacterium]